MMLDLARFSGLPVIGRQARVVPEPVLGDHSEKLVESKYNTSFKHHHKRCNRIQKRSPSQSIKILEQEIARNTPESQVWAGSTATTLIPRFFLGKEYRFEDHDSTLFVALKRKTPQHQFQLANAL